MQKVGRERCDRCKRLIKNGRVQYINERPYGENCYNITMHLQVTFDEQQLRFESETSETESKEPR